MNYYTELKKGQIVEMNIWTERGCHFVTGAMFTDFGKNNLYITVKTGTACISMFPRSNVFDLKVVG